MNRIFCWGLCCVLLGPSCYPANESLSAVELEERRVTPGPLMRAGENCLRCHQENGTAKNVWTAAGTVYLHDQADREQGLAGVKVILQNPSGKTVTLFTNEAGNFFTAEPLEQGYSVRIEKEGKSMAMSSPPPAGSCNACHSLPPVGNAPGRIFLSHSKDE